MATATMTSRVLGLVREQVMAWMYGANAVSDIFWVAFRIPNMLRDLFAEGSFSAAFVPTFTEKLKEGQQRANALLWSLALFLLIATGAIVVLIIIFSPEILHLMAPTLKNRPADFLLGVSMLRWMAPFLTVISLAALFMGALNSLRYFFLPALAPAFMNVVMIICMLGSSLLATFRMDPALSLAIGVLLGGVIQALIQLPKLWQLKMRPVLSELNLFGPDSKKVFARLGFGTIGIAATQINVMVSTILATGSAVGAVSWLSYGFRLYQLPVGILGVSLASSNLVHFSHAWKAEDREGAVSSLSSAFFFNLFFMLPAALYLFQVGPILVEILFQRGAFSSEDTFFTAQALAYYLMSLPFYGIYKILSPVFYAVDRPRIPVVVSMVSVGVNIIFSMWATPRYGFAMLALGTTLSIAFNAICLSVAAHRVLSLPFRTFINQASMKVLFAGLFAAIAMHFLPGLLAQVIINADGLLLKILHLILVFMIGACAYFFPFLFFRERKLALEMMQKVIQKIRRK